MRRNLLRRGMFGLAGSFLLVSLLAFYLDGVAAWFGWSVQQEAELLGWGFVAAATIGCASCIIVVQGLLSLPRAGSRVRLLPAMIVLLLTLLLFGFLFYSSLHDPPRQPLRPGETLTI